MAEVLLLFVVFVAGLALTAWAAPELRLLLQAAWTEVHLLCIRGWLALQDADDWLRDRLTR